MQDLLKPGLLGYPLVVEYLGTILGIAFLIAFGRWNIGQGKKDATTPEQGRILGALIDDKKANEIISAINKHCHEIADNTKAVHELKASVTANTATSVSLGGEIDDLSTDIRELGREIVRSSK